MESSCTSIYISTNKPIVGKLYNGGKRYIDRGSLKMNFEASSTLSMLFFCVCFVFVFCTASLQLSQQRHVEVFWGTPIAVPSCNRN